VCRQVLLEITGHAFVKKDAHFALPLRLQ
jgi:hypothetical protein